MATGRVRKDEDRIEERVMEFKVDECGVTYSVDY